MRDGIFVSYSHKDTKTVEEIVKSLRESTGKEVWFDHKLRGGENYFSVIANQIVENKYFVFIVSDNSIESDWCLRELEFAASENRHIIAIWLDNISISPRVKLIIQNTHYINWYSSSTDVFSNSVISAFENGPAVVRNTASADLDSMFSGRRKYYLCKEKLKEIVDLLRAEENEKYGHCFKAENANLLGMAYEFGLNVEADTKKALLYYKASKHSGNMDGQYLYAALKLQSEPENKLLVSEMLDAAEKGSAIALACVGDCYYKGELGLTPDKAKAIEYFKRAAQLNNIESMYYLAYFYRIGEIVPKDPEIAYMYALKAKEKEFPRAYRVLGYMYENGDFVERDYDKAINCYEQAISHGDFLCYCYQGGLYGKTGFIDKKAELYKKAVDLAEKGEITSGLPFYRLAVLYDDGTGVEKDIRKAIHYYFKALERNHNMAKRWTVPCIMKLEGSEKIEYLKKALEFDCEKAAYELGMIEKGERESGDRLPEAAVLYFEKGALSGDSGCVIELIYNYSWVMGAGKNDDNCKDREETLKWFRLFFALASKGDSHIKSLREDDILASYYYAYAIELDCVADVNKQDREFVIYNFKKSIEESPRHLGQIINFAVSGFLFPEESGSGYSVDVVHAEEILEISKDHLVDYWNMLKTKGHSYEKLPDYISVINNVKRGYQFISKCYKTGKYVNKDRAKAEKFSALADKFSSKS